MKNIAIIGAGQLGSRHLQALALIKNINLYIVDPSEEALNLCKARFNEVNKYKKSITCLNNIKKLPEDIEFAVISTNSKQRLSVLKQLISHSIVKFILLEKFLFPDIQEYDEATELLNKINTKVYVNCSRTMWQGYKKLKNEIDISQPLVCKVIGTNWNMSSNSIHFFNLFMYLIEEENATINVSMIDNDLIDNKREGYIDFTGKISITTPNDNILILESKKNGNKPLTIYISSPTQKIEICESKGTFSINQKKDSFQIEYQSQLTNLVYEQLQKEGNCDLISFSQSKVEHLILLKAFKEFLGSRVGAIT